MSSRRYLKPINGLPDPRGSLSTTMSREAIAAADQEVQKDCGLMPETKKNVANTKSILQHSVLLLEGTALGMEQLPLCDNSSHKTLLKLLHFIFFTRASLTALWCALISRMYDRVRVCALWLYQIFFDLYQFSSLGSGDEN